MSKHIVALEIENIAGIKAFRIEPNGKHVVIGGPNGAGKTSVLTAIAGAFGGGKNRKGQRVRKGSEKGRVVADLGDLVVTWRTTETGNDYLEVESKDGASFKRPQQILDRLWGARTFDPLEFFNADAKRQTAMLSDLAGLDLDDFEKRRREVYEERTGVNRLGKELRTQAEGPEYQVPEDTPAEPIDVEAIGAALRKAEETNANNAALRGKLEDYRERLERAEGTAADSAAAIETTVERATSDGEADVARAERVLAEAQEALAAAKLRRDEAIARARSEAEAAAAAAKERRDEIATRVDRGTEIVDGLEDVDADALAAELNGAQRINRAVEFRASRDRLLEAAAAKEAKSAELSEALAALETEKAEALAGADLPIDGLGIEEGAVTWNGKALELLSGSERLRVSVAIGVATHPEIAVMLIDRWNDLDDDGRETVRAMADAAGVQIWTTIVGTRDEEITVKIRDGEIEAPPKPLEIDAEAADEAARADDAAAEEVSG
jgi:energy-coupling factor transporter ATP-binding protein EcfA2